MEKLDYSTTALDKNSTHPNVTKKTNVKTSMRSLKYFCNVKSKC